MILSPSTASAGGPWRRTGSRSARRGLAAQPGLPGRAAARRRRSPAQPARCGHGGDLHHRRAAARRRRSRAWSWTGAPVARRRPRWSRRCCCPTACPTARSPTRAAASSFGPLPPGEYIVYGVLDQNQNRRADGARGVRQRAPGARARRRPASSGRSCTTRAVRDPHGRPSPTAFGHDRAQPAVSTRSSASQPAQTVLRSLPDSTPRSVVSLLPKPLDDSLSRRAAAPTHGGGHDQVRHRSRATAPRRARARRGRASAEQPRRAAEEAQAARPAARRSPTAVFAGRPSRGSPAADTWSSSAASGT